MRSAGDSRPTGARAPARLDEYLGDVSEEGRAALGAELAALERELRQAGETLAQPESGPIAEAPTIAPSSPRRGAPSRGLATSSGPRGPHRGTLPR